MSNPFLDQLFGIGGGAAYGLPIGQAIPVPGFEQSAMAALANSQRRAAQLLEPQYVLRSLALHSGPIRYVDTLAGSFVQSWTHDLDQAAKFSLNAAMAVAQRRAAVIGTWWTGDRDLLKIVPVKQKMVAKWTLV